VIDRNFSAENQDNAVDPGAQHAVLAGNGKLTAEIFAAAGIPVGVRPAPAVTDGFGTNARSKSFFEGAIAAEWRKNVASIIQTGKLLNQAKDELDRDVFAALMVPFEPRVSQMLRRIAAHPVLSNPANFSSLPPCWRTLYELTKLSDALLRAALADGRIHPSLKQKEVRGLRGLPPAGTKTSETDGQEEAPVDPVAVWKTFSPADKTTILDGEGRTGLANLVSPTLLAELVDHAIGQQINTAPAPNAKLQVTLTNILIHAVYAYTTDDILRAFTAFRNKCRANHLDPRDVSITFRKKRKR
jgi:hypothetical protein